MMEWASENHEKNTGNIELEQPLCSVTKPPANAWSSGGAREPELFGKCRAAGIGDPKETCGEGPNQQQQMLPPGGDIMSRGTRLAGYEGRANGCFTKNFLLRAKQPGVPEGAVSPSR